MTDAKARLSHRDPSVLVLCCHNYLLLRAGFSSPSPVSGIERPVDGRKAVTRKTGRGDDGDSARPRALVSRSLAADDAAERVARRTLQPPSRLM